MVGKTSFVVGVAAGYVLGSKAGRERYDQIVAAVREIQDNQTVQTAAGVLQQQAIDLVETARAHVGH